MKEENDTKGLAWVFVIVILVAGIVFFVESSQFKEEEAHEKSCERCEITGIKGVGIGKGSRAYIYETTCGDLLRDSKEKVGDVICKETLWGG